MNIRISTTDGVPIYMQIMNHIKYLTASGQLQAGEELPPVRVLAETLLVNPNTVARAYRELESAGVVTTRGHVQTVVTEWGIAELHGRSLGERARALIAIAHPDFRDELTAAARKTLFL